MASKKSKLKPAPKTPTRLPIENVELVVRKGEEIAYGWTPWIATDRRFQEPEFLPQKLVDHGPWVQGIRSDSRYDACLWQHVRTTPDLAVVFSMDFKITSEHELSDDDRWPEGLMVGVGIDPSGGDDPRSDKVQWALRDLRYSQVVPASVIAIAQEDVVTVFVRSLAFIPGSSTTAGNGTGRECKLSCYREDYDRTYLLLYQGAEKELWESAAQKASEHQWTIGSSADDAGLGGNLLPKRRVKAVYQRFAGGRHWPWEDDFGKQWYEGHYPPGSSLQFEWVHEDDLENL
jgi:hypothetical protein